MVSILRDQRTDVDPVVAAAELLTTTGIALIPSSDVTRSLGVDREAWTRFARYWWHLPGDPCAAGPGVRRLRRYGRYLVLHGLAYPLPYSLRDREFEPLTDAFAENPLLHNLIKLLTRMAACLDDVAEWNVKVHPFRIRSSTPDGGGHTTPENLHRDGVTLFSTLLVGRRNATGGENSVCDSGGRELLTTTLAEPGTLLLGDDRRTLHGASPIRPIDGAEPAQRDVLVITFASAWP